jgi:hypothetical protein
MYSQQDIWEAVNTGFAYLQNGTATSAFLASMPDFTHMDSKGRTRAFNIPPPELGIGMRHMNFHWHQGTVLRGMVVATHQVLIV